MSLYPCKDPIGKWQTSRPDCDKYHQKDVEESNIVVFRTGFELCTVKKIPGGIHYKM